jgi:hypothetical protein
MVRRGFLRAFAVCVAVGSVLLLCASTALAAGGEDCSVSVSPRAGAAGTVFTFSGSGFTPDTLVLHKGASDAGSHTLDLEHADPWHVTVRSRPGDEGAWSAELRGSACSPVARFTVTLANTDAASAADHAPANGTPPIALLLVVIGAGAVGGVALGGRLRAQLR